jgi:hypothetical protein
VLDLHLPSDCFEVVRVVYLTPEEGGGKPGQEDTIEGSVGHTTGCPNRGHKYACVPKEEGRIDRLKAYYERVAINHNLEDEDESIPSPFSNGELVDDTLFEGLVKSNPSLGRGPRSSRAPAEFCVKTGRLGGRTK